MCLSLNFFMCYFSLFPFLTSSVDKMCMCPFLLHYAVCTHLFSPRCRGQAGFDNSGRGQYFAGPPPPPLPPYAARPSDRQPYPEMYPQRFPQPLPPLTHNHYNPVPPSSNQNSPNHNQSSKLSTTSPRVPPEFYQGKPAQSALIHTVSSNTIGTVDSNATANNNKNHSKEIEDKDKEKMR